MEASNENSSLKNSLIVTLGFSTPHEKVTPAFGSASIKRVFFPYSVAATEQARAIDVFPTPPAAFAITTNFISHPRISALQISIAGVVGMILALVQERYELFSTPNQWLEFVPEGLASHKVF